MKWYSVLFQFIIASFLISCAITSPLQERIEMIPENERSYVVGQFSVECKPSGEKCKQGFNSLMVYYRNTEDVSLNGRLNSTHGSLFGNDTTYDFVNTKKREKGCFFCIPLPAGPYEFYTFEFYNFAGGGSGYSIKEDYHFSLPFELSPGEVVYVGRLKLTTAWGKNIFGMDVGGPGVLLLSEDPVNDVKEALKKCPERVRGRKVRIAPVKAFMAKKSGLVHDE
jgi:hypothetical protein